MKKLGKRTLALFIAVLLCVSLMPITASANTYSQITVKYVVNGVTLRTDTLSSGRYIQIANRVPYVSDLIAGTAYADYDYGTVTKIECRPLQYFPGSALTLREGQSIDHSGNYPTHTITYTTSKWEKHNNSGVTDPGTSTTPGTSGGSGSYFLQVVYVNKSKTEYSFGPRIASSSTARIWYYDNDPVKNSKPAGYSLAGWQTSHYHGTNGFLTKGWWPIFGSSTTSLYVLSGIQATVALYSGEGVYLIYQANQDPAPPATYSYQLNWDYNGGTLNGEDHAQESAMNLTGDDNTTHTFYEQLNKRPSRDGYTFQGWTYSGNGTYTVSNGQIVMTGKDGSTVSGTMTAQWKAIPTAKATLTYDANGGSNPPAEQTVTLGGDATVAGKGNMSKPGYTFKGWSTDQEATEPSINPNDVLRMDGDVTLYAVWEEEPTPTPTPTESDYTVSWYDADNGEEIKAPETRKGNVGEEVTVTDADKVVSGYTFAEDNKDNVLRAVLENASNTELKLYFTKNPDNKIKVTWMDGYTSTPIRVETIDPDPDTNSDVFKTMYPADPTREGWKFTGWGEPETDDDGNITITAQWQKDVTDPATYTVTYKTEKDGDVIGEPETVTEGNSTTIETGPEAPDGKEFVGWSTDPDDPDVPVYHPGDDFTPEGDTTFYPVWKDKDPGPEEPKTVTVTFIDGYDDTEIGEKITDWVKGETVPEDRYPARPTHTDKDPDGWTVAVDPETGNITITAQWKDKQPAEPTPTPTSRPTPPPVNPNPPTPPTPTTTYTVNWEDGDGNIIKTTTTTSTTVPDSLYPADPEREGESFTGWGEPEISGTVITIIAQWDEEIDEPDVPLIVAPGLDAVNHFAYIIGYGDGTVRPGRNITRAEVATIFYRLMTDDYRGTYWSQTNTFTDVNSGDWFNNAVSTSAEAELVKGYADGTFKGKNNITRAEFATIAARFLSDEPTGENPFTDIQGHWAETDILKAYEAGWINGYADGSFRPNAKITRAEAMTIVNRMLNRVPHAEDLHEDMVTYPDNQPDAWYYAAVQEATNSHDYDMGDRDGETVETWTAMKANRNWAALEKEWSNAYSGSNGNDVM